MKLIKAILKQRQIGEWWGGFKQAAAQLGLYLLLFNLILITMTAYTTTIAPWMHQRGIAIPFWVFMGAIILFLILALIFEYKITLPSHFSFWNTQFYRHGSQLRKDIKELHDRLSNIEELIKGGSYGSDIRKTKK